LHPFFGDSAAFDDALAANVPADAATAFLMNDLRFINISFQNND
jgi:hypothetical protein